ncbi:MAG: hypothetical protein JW908_12100 [Anaerolineales bacterium]|nr:hypothetical protein [Anaerolineales bacterium]
MSNPRKIKTLHRGSCILIALMLIVLLTPIMAIRGKASTPKSLNATMGSLCGKLVFLTEAKTGATRLGLRPCAGNEKPYVFEQNPADLFNTYQFKDIEIESGEPFDSVEYGKLTKYITEWAGYFQLTSCSDCNTGKVVVPTPTLSPFAETAATETQAPVIMDTATSTPEPLNVSLVIANFEADPGNPVLKQRFILRLTIENRGDYLDAASWDYSGQVSLKDGNGNEVESYSFSKDEFSYIKPATENGQQISNKWVISIPVTFMHEVENGRLSVSLQPDEYPISPGMVEAMVTLKPAGQDMKSCASAVAEKTSSFFADDPALKTAWDGEIAAVVATSCAADDVVCYSTPLAQGLVKTLLVTYPDIQGNAWSSHASLMNKLLAALAGIFDVNVLQVCQQPDQWLWNIVEELNRQGLNVNLLKLSSSAVLKISNAAGDITGVLISGERVNQIPDSQVVQWNQNIYILYSLQEVLITVQGISDGTFDLQGIMSKGGERVALAYENITVTDSTLAMINTADSSGDMQLDSNGDGQTDSMVPVSRADVIPQETTLLEAFPTATAASSGKIPFRLPCMSAATVVLPLAGIWFVRRRNIRGDRG